ncbi:hypothetical protein BO99DRAFT_411874 [Aspergillus violaceofuscus CBS 115571]|uniref:Uncharacterized protein n=1 Tax=Aspergillus violaceofuscus (strain CBS 115571) TaxID=1450538 RepID=A0A2V5HGC2_ASPV1|nr:hypothetical protein BO99DRAFT_411874 [Aspergillus violaceofuscus CBS 115571]
MQHFTVYGILALLYAYMGYTEAITEVCNAITGNFACGVKITLPTAAEAKYCPNKFFETDACKTRKTYRYPCPTWRKPGRTCDGWTCVPGTREKWINVPCGINIKTKNVGLCDAVQSELQVNLDLLKKTAAMCDCIPKVLALSTDGSLKAANAISDVSSATSGVLTVYAELQKIDLATYIKFAGALGTCIAGSVTERDLKPTPRLSRSLDHQFRGDAWDLETLETSVGTITNSARNVQNKISTLGAPACGDATGCTTSTDRFEVMRTIQLQLSLLQDTVTVSDAVSTVSSMSSIIKNAKEAASVPLTEEEIITIIREERIQKLADILQVFKFPADFRKLIDDLRNTIPTISQFSTALDTRTKAISGNITDVVSDSWLQQADVSGDAAHDLRQNIATIQEEFRAQAMPAITDLQTKTKRITAMLSALPFRGKPPSMDVKVASYHRWSRIATNMPCSRWARKGYSVQGYRGSFNYPQFYNCLLDTTVPWPNHHIPYLKITFQ